MNLYQWKHELKFKILKVSKLMLKVVALTLGRRFKMTSPCDAESFLYFAYGSNLSSERIKISNPSAKAVGPALLEHYALDFNYHSKVKCVLQTRASL